MSRRFQFSLSTLFWGMFAVAIYCGSWQIARYWLNADSAHATFFGAMATTYALMGAFVFVIYLNMPLDD